MTLYLLYGFLNGMQTDENFAQEYRIRLRRIEEALSAALPDTVDESWIRRVAGSPLPVSSAAFDRINAPAHALVGRGGKRWRPLVMTLACELSGGGEAALPLTPLVELPHTGSLIVDDIEDGAEERRGEAAVHLLFGIDASINTGNFLYFLPSYLIENSPLPEERQLRLYRVYLRYMRRLHLGQGLDIQWHNDHQAVPSVDEYLTMCRMKTGCLAAMAAELGATAGGGSPDFALTLGSILENLGIAFQILDDVRNLTTGNPGKRRGDDIVEGKKSLPVILHLHKHPDEVDVFRTLFTEAAEKGIEGAEQVIENAIGRMERSGSIREAERTARSLITEARSRITGVCPDSLPRRLLVGLTDSFLEKKQ